MSLLRLRLNTSADTRNIPHTSSSHLSSTRICKSLFTTWGILCGLVFLILAIFLLFIGISEMNRVRTYVRNNCLIKRSWLEECSEQDSNFKKRKQCIQPKWLIQYVDDETNEQVIISNIKRWVSYERYIIY